LIAPFNNYAVIMEMFEDILKAMPGAVMGSNVVYYQKK